jgi:hypothetical protein
MAKFGRIALYALLVLGYWVGIDVQHTSMNIAFLCAAGCGVLWSRT